MSSTIHKNWLRPFDPREWKMKRAWLSEKAARDGVEPRVCDYCEQEYTPRQVQQATCGSDECRADHERTGARERARLRKMLAEADQKRQEYDGIGKAQMAEVKRAFRETRNLS